MPLRFTDSPRVSWVVVASSGNAPGFLLLSGEIRRATGRDTGIDTIETLTIAMGSPLANLTGPLAATEKTFTIPVPDACRVRENIRRGWFVDRLDREIFELTTDSIKIC